MILLINANNSKDFGKTSTREYDTLITTWNSKDFDGWWVPMTLWQTLITLKTYTLTLANTLTFKRLFFNLTLWQLSQIELYSPQNLSLILWNLYSNFFEHLKSSILGFIKNHETLSHYMDSTLWLLELENSYTRFYKEPWNFVTPHVNLFVILVSLLLRYHINNLF